jgi:2'-5' RNA ligase
MRPIAVDVAILLPPAARRQLQRLNAAYPATAGRGFRFDDTHHPHVTLGQHFVDVDGVEAVRADLTPIFARQSPIDLQITGARSGRTSQAAVVDPTPDLQRLHERVLHALESHEVIGTRDAFQVDDHLARDADVRWVTRFRPDSAFDRFDPHITIGIGPAPPALTPWRLTANAVALCRLGRFCTCRNRLADWTL